jgi:His-Xaa-Ser system radical SAM maturase HxsC
MLTLSGRVIKKSEALDVHDGRNLFSVTTNADLPTTLKEQKAYLSFDAQKIPPGFKHYLFISDDINEDSLPKNSTIIGKNYEYIGNNDVIALSADGRIRSIFRANSNHNSILLTEQCNNFCLMCSQPPKRVNDEWLLREAFDAIKIIPRNTKEIGFTGGEPTIYGHDFIKLLHHAKNWLPHTSIHILSNGRSFSKESYARAYAEVNHPDLMIGIPVYSSDPSVHDYVVQAHGAFDETIRGIVNLKKLNQRVEIRVVIHKQTYKGLVELANFIARNLIFVDQVALMGLENIGFTRANIEDLWIDPIEYKDILSEATRILVQYGIKTSIYNHQLCLVNPDIQDHYIKSISDWKNEFAPECAPCSRKHDCGGFFSSGIANGYGKSITPFAN